MRCSKYDHLVLADTYEELDFEYTGEFDVIGTSSGAVLVEKKYARDCPRCTSGSGTIIKKELEMVPHDSLDFADGV